MPLTTEEFLRLVYRAFRREGSWPLVRDLQVELRQHGTLRLLVARAGSRYVQAESSEEGVCFLTLRGLKECPEAAADLAAYVQVVRYVAQQAIAEGPRRIPAAEVERLLGNDPHARQRAGEIAYRDCRVHGGWEGSPANFVLQARRDTVFYEGVTTVDDIFAVEDRLDAEGRETSTLLWNREPDSEGPDATEESDEQLATLPSDLSINRPALKVIADQDLRALVQAVESKAWRSAALFAGFCLEALILDHWYKSEAQAEAKWGRHWPYRVHLDELVTTAEEYGLISSVHRDLASTLRKARNLVHPLRASKTAPVSRSFVGLLVAALIHLNDELGRK